MDRGILRYLGTAGPNSCPIEELRAITQRPIFTWGNALRFLKRNPLAGTFPRIFLSLCWISAVAARLLVPCSEWQFQFVRDLRPEFSEDIKSHVRTNAD